MRKRRRNPSRGSREAKARVHREKEWNAGRRPSEKRQEASARLRIEKRRNRAIENFRNNFIENFWRPRRSSQEGSARVGRRWVSGNRSALGDSE